ncbi:hypothetical protein F5Y07DRAFT_399839 [Xylaria sp. FL0933]|nr:hypothetical protein F5Y07DRAFT_399839 [Xylaria sp. FL0933]
MSQVRRLYHYTNKAGYDGILATMFMKPSVVEGIKHTHYGKGIYLTDLAPSNFKQWGDRTCIEWLFNSINSYTVKKTAYVIALDCEAIVKANIHMEVMVDNAKFGHVWLLPLESELKISQLCQFDMSGLTDIGRRIEAGVELLAMDRPDASTGSDKSKAEKAPSTTKVAGNYAHSLKNHGGNLGVYPVSGVPGHKSDYLRPEVPLDDGLQFNEPTKSTKFAVVQKKHGDGWKTYYIVNGVLKENLD